VLGSANVTAVVVQPDGTTAVPTIANPQVGQYPIDFTPTMLGRHQLQVSATAGILGTIVRKQQRMFMVDTAAVGWLVSLGDAKRHLNIPDDDTTDDEELEHFLSVVSEFIEARTNTQTLKTYTETYNNPGWAAILLRHGPVQSVASVSVGGVVVSSGTYEVAGFGDMLRPVGGPWAWRNTNDNVTVTYTAGPPVTEGIPWRVRHATLQMLNHLWQTQRGASQVARPGPFGSGDDAVYDPRSGFSFPRAVVELIEDKVERGTWVG
jgi:hypothetical protein